jgi:ketosteroid isomerase-like protein
MDVKGVFAIAFLAMMLTVSAVAQTQFPSATPPLSVSPTEIREEEVREFFAKYLDRYIRKDTEGFLSFFSEKALQNQKEGIAEIRKSYSTFFDQSHELKYQIQEPKLELYENGAEMNARYEITQILRRSGEKRSWTGSASWFLIKEDGVLKILYLNFQHQKSL